MGKNFIDFGGSQNSLTKYVYFMQIRWIAKVKLIVNGNKLVL